MCSGGLFTSVCACGGEGGGGVWFEIKQPPNHIGAMVLPLDSKLLLGTAI